jgi:hypothetical protein
MKLSIAFAGAAIAALGMAGAASANTIYDNPYGGVGGDCSFSTTCAAQSGRGDDFAAQEFTLASDAVVTSASFTEQDFGIIPTDVKWGFALADGPGGLPGTFLSAGEDSISSSTILGVDSGGYNVTKLFFDVGPQALGPGTYYFAIQAISPVFETYLGFGVAAGGAAETHDGGATWSPGYELDSIGADRDSIAVALYGEGGGGGGVPEPATWALMLVGFGGIGAALRRRERTASAA